MSTGLRFTLEVDGLPPDAFAVVSFHLTQSLSSLFSLDLSLVSQQFLSLEFAQVLDKMAYLTVWQGDDVQRRVKGVVTWFELGENDKNQMLYSMKVCPPLWRTGLRQNFRIFQNEDIESILATILKENGVTEWSPLFSEPHPSREFCVQYGETDYDFLCRMAAEEGIFFYEEHAQKSTDQSLVLCDTVRYLPESFEIPWNPNTRTEVSTLCISQFRYSAQIRPSSVVTKDYTFKRPGWAGRFDQEGQYQDQQYDEESGLYYNRNRYYDPLQGRYITQDPIGLRGEWNLYKYPLNPVRFIDSLGLKFHVNGDPSDFNQAVEYLKQDSQMKETIDFLSSSEETINIEYIEGTNVRFNSNNMAIYWNSRASLFCSTELNSKSQSPALGLGHEFAHAQYYLLDKENFMALLSRTDKKYENKEEARVITIIESRAAKTLGECTRGAHSGLPFYRVDGPLQTMKITGTPE